MVILLTIVVAFAGMTPFVSAPPPPPAVIVSLDINHASSFWGIPMDSDWNTPAWHIRAAIAHLIDKAQVISLAAVSSTYPTATVIDNPIPDIPQFSSYYLTWNPLMLASVDPYHSGATSLYNNVPMAPDTDEATEHLILAGGIGWDNQPWHDTNNDNRIDNPPNSKIVYYWNTGNVFREAVGNYLEQQIEYVFNDADIVDAIEVSWLTMLQIFTRPPYDWHLMLWGFVMSMTPPSPDSLFYYTIPNLLFYSNSMYDYYVSLGIPPAINAKVAEFYFGGSIGAIPIWST